MCRRNYDVFCDAHFAFWARFAAGQNVYINDASALVCYFI